MPSRLPTRFPVGTKYIVEGRGLFVRRYVEFPNGRKVQLTTRKALSCTRAELQQISIAPDQTSALMDASALRALLIPQPPSPTATISCCPQCTATMIIRLVEPDLKNPLKERHVFECQECGLPRTYLVDRETTVARH
jgi:hypothetical protein